MCLGWYSFVRGVDLVMYNCTILCKSVCRSSVYRFCLFVFNFLHFSFHIYVSLVLLCTYVLILLHFGVWFQHDLFVSFVIFACASFSQLCSALYLLFL